MYFDTCYVAKFYLDEPESLQVRNLILTGGPIYSSVWALAEFHAVIHRHLREASITVPQARDIAARFSTHVNDGLWNLVPVTEALLRRTSGTIVAAPPDLFLRAADAVHLTSAQDISEREIWTNDRHVLAAASYFGLIGRSV